jgi:hypothetical protein
MRAMVGAPIKIRAPDRSLASSRPGNPVTCWDSAPTSMTSGVPRITMGKGGGGQPDSSIQLSPGLAV